MSIASSRNIEETEKCILCGHKVIMCFGRSYPICNHCERWSSKKEIRLAQHIHTLQIALADLTDKCHIIK